MPYLVISTAPHRLIDSDLAIVFIITRFSFRFIYCDLASYFYLFAGVTLKHGERRDDTTPFQQGRREEQCQKLATKSF